MIALHMHAFRLYANDVYFLVILLYTTTTCVCVCVCVCE